MNNSCQNREDLLAELIVGNDAAVNEHTNSCATCAQVVNDYRKLRSNLRQTPPELSDATARAIFVRINDTVRSNNSWFKQLRWLVGVPVTVSVGALIAVLAWPSAPDAPVETASTVAENTLVDSDSDNRRLDIDNRAAEMVTPVVVERPVERPVDRPYPSEQIWPHAIANVSPDEESGIVEESGRNEEPSIAESPDEEPGRDEVVASQHFDAGGTPVSPCGPDCAAEVEPLQTKETTDILEKIEATLQGPSTDSKARVFLKQKRPGQPDRVSELYVFHRNKDDALVLLFTKPKINAGVAFLRLRNNSWRYTPSAEKWERETARNCIAGPCKQRDAIADILSGDAPMLGVDAWDLLRKYHPTYRGTEKLGSFEAHRLELVIKPGSDATFPSMVVWVDAKSHVPLKIESRLESGRVARTLYFPKWEQVQGKNDNESIPYPKEVRIYDELGKGSQVLIRVTKLELGDLPHNLFTKAWLESQSR